MHSGLWITEKNIVINVSKSKVNLVNWSRHVTTDHDLRQMIDDIPDDRTSGCITDGLAVAVLEMIFDVLVIFDHFEHPRRQHRAPRCIAVEPVFQATVLEHQIHVIYARTNGKTPDVNSRMLIRDAAIHCQDNHHSTIGYFEVNWFISLKSLVDVCILTKDALFQAFQYLFRIGGNIDWRNVRLKIARKISQNVGILKVVGVIYLNSSNSNEIATLVSQDYRHHNWRSYPPKILILRPMWRYPKEYGYILNYLTPMRFCLSNRSPRAQYIVGSVSLLKGIPSPPLE